MSDNPEALIQELMTHADDYCRWRLHGQKDEARAILESALRAALAQQAATPAAQWRKDGEPDPHGSRYDCERAQLAMGRLSDDELANGAFMNYDVRPTLEQIIAGTHHSPIAWMTAVKDRIRWLSRALEKERAAARQAAKEQP